MAIRSEVVEVGRLHSNSVNVLTKSNETVTHAVLSDLFPDLLVGEKRVVRITVEGLEDKKEESVGSKEGAVLRIKRNSPHSAFLCDETGSCSITGESLSDLVGENLEVGQIREFRLTLEFVETPLEKLKREFKEIDDGAGDLAGRYADMCGLVQECFAAMDGK